LRPQRGRSIGGASGDRRGGDERPVETRGRTLTAEVARAGTLPRGHLREHLMNFWLLNAITASRLFGCAPLWFWCWWRRPRRMVLWMVLIAAWYLVTDHYDGQWAREVREGEPPAAVRPFLEHVDDLAQTYTLESRLGFWLD